MAELIEMEKVAGRYQPAHDLMQDIPQTKREGIDVQDHHGDFDPTVPAGTESQRVKQTQNNYSRVNNVFQDKIEADQVQTEALQSQSKAIDTQTSIMREQSVLLGDINASMGYLYDIMKREASKINPKMQPFASGAEKDKNANLDFDFEKGFRDLIQAINEKECGGAGNMLDVLGGEGKNKRGRRRVGNRGPGRLSRIGGMLGDGIQKIGGAGADLFRTGASKFGGFISGLGARGSNAIEGIGDAFRGGGGGGWRGKAAKAAIGAGAAIAGYKGLESLGGLGAISAHFESGGKGVDTISSGAGDHGGVSYGKHQLSSKSGTMAKFLRSEHGAQYAAQFAGLTPGSAAFNAAYKNVVEKDREGFAKAQEGFMKATHYDPQANKLARETGFDVSQRSRAMQELVFSTATQYGGNTSVIKNALQGVDANAMSDEDLIARIQDYKRDSVGTHFKSSSANVQASVAKRAEREKAMLLKVLADERANPQQVAKDEKREPIAGVEAAEVIANKAELPPAIPADQPVGIFPMVDAEKAVKKENTEVNVSQSGGGIEALPTVQADGGMSTSEAVGATAAAAGVAKTGTAAVSGTKSVISNGVTGVTARGAGRAIAKSVPVVGNVALGAYDAAEIINNDSMTKEEKQRGLVGVGGGMAGAGAGAALGATAGSVVPVVGTAIGGIVGGIAGYYLGEKGATKTMDMAMGTPEERAAANKSSLVQGQNFANVPVPVTLPTVKDLMTIKPKEPTEVKTDSLVQAQQAHEAKKVELARYADIKQRIFDGKEVSQEDMQDFRSWLSGAGKPKTTAEPSSTSKHEANVAKFGDIKKRISEGGDVSKEELQEFRDWLNEAKPSPKKDGISSSPTKQENKVSADTLTNPPVDSKAVNSLSANSNPTTPASPEFYKTEPTISQKPQTQQTPTPTMVSSFVATPTQVNPVSSQVPMSTPTHVARPAAQAISSAPAPEGAQRNQFDTVQNVRMAVDQPAAAPAAPGAAPAGPAAGGTGNKGSDKPTLDEVPALVNEFGLIFVNTGFI